MSFLVSCCLFGRVFLFCVHVVELCVLCTLRCAYTDICVCVCIHMLLSHVCRCVVLCILRLHRYLSICSPSCPGPAQTSRDTSKLADSTLLPQRNSGAPRIGLAVEEYNMGRQGGSTMLLLFWCVHRSCVGCIVNTLLSWQCSYSRWVEESAFQHILCIVHSRVLERVGGGSGAQHIITQRHHRQGDSTTLPATAHQLTHQRLSTITDTFSTLQYTIHRYQFNFAKKKRLVPVTAHRYFLQLT